MTPPTVLDNGSFFQETVTAPAAMPVSVYDRQCDLTTGQGSCSPEKVQTQEEPFAMILAQAESDSKALGRRPGRGCHRDGPCVSEIWRRSCTTRSCPALLFAFTFSW